MITIGAYVRMSQDDDLDDPERRGEGVRRQLADCRALARERGWLIGKVYEDNDASAFKEDRRRPAFEELLKDLADGIIDGGIAYDLDRVARQPLDLERLIDVYVRSPGPLIFATCVEDVDLADFEGQQRARECVFAALQESRNMSRRIARVNKARAETGLAHHGGRRPFGWQRDGIRVDPYEAELIRQAYRDILAGDSISGVRRRWIEAGVTPLRTKRSGEQPRRLNHRSVRDRLINPRLCGYRTYIPQSVRESLGRAPWLPDHVVRDGQGEPVSGDWEPIVTVKEWRRLVTLLGSRAKAKERASHCTSVRYLLSGIARCGRCGCPLRQNPYTSGSEQAARYGFRYQCRTADGGCGGVSRVGPLTDDTVQAALLDHLRSAAVRARQEVELCLPAAPGSWMEARRLLQELGHAWTRRSAGSLSLEEFERERAEVATLTAERMVEIRAASARRESLAQSLPVVIARWAELPLAEKRSHIREWATDVFVHPTGRGSRFDPSRIEVRWRTGAHHRDSQSKSIFHLFPISLISNVMEG
ncbi:recombinase family protein [Streptomyces sp. NPDC048415]|uniref:recombinase family protein n=1 Tax=Streptomyces sp. NPDC048415 TaxID=3154822 RepID=UPI00343AB674